MAGAAAAACRKRRREGSERIGILSDEYTAGRSLSLGLNGRVWSFYIPRGKRRPEGTPDAGGAGGFACQALPKEHRIAGLAGRDAWNQALPERLHGTPSESTTGFWVQENPVFAGSVRPGRRNRLPHQNHIC